MATRLFRPAARYPADPRVVYVFVVSVITGVTALMLQATPNTLHAVLPRWIVVAWAILLALGSAFTLLGMSLQNANGIILEQIGCVAVGSTTIVYSVIAVAIVGPSAIQTVGIIFGWGFACLIRWCQLQALLKDSIRRAEKRAVLDRLEAELEARLSYRRPK